MKTQVEQITDKTAHDLHRQAWLTYCDIKYANIPKHARPAYKPFNDAKTNSITQAVSDFITWNGGFCNRQQSQGQYDPRSGKFRHGTVKKGSSDLIAVIPSPAHGHALSVHIEIKSRATRDRMSDHQKKYQADVVAAGAEYIIVSRVADFIHWWITTTQVKP